MAPVMLITDVTVGINRAIARVILTYLCEQTVGNVEQKQ